MTDIPPPPPFPPPSGPPAGPGGPDAGAALSYGWKKFQENVGPLLGVVLIPIAVQIVFSLLGQSIHGIFAAFLFQLIAIVAGAIAGLGIYRVALMITAGEPVSVGKAFQYDRMGEWVVFSVVFGLGVGITPALVHHPGTVLPRVLRAGAVLFPRREHEPRRGVRCEPRSRDAARDSRSRSSCRSSSARSA